MGKNWAICIGINGYRNLQPLQFAMRDAQLMQAYFQNEVQFQTVYYFSDQSPPIVQDYGPPLDSLPTFTTLMRFLRVRFERAFLETGDNLWFFFAGHGIRHDDRDFLMPIDGDPGDIDRTAIPLNYVTERLRRSGADNVVLLLDACRVEERRAGQGIGQEFQQGVITMFSCSPQEASYEINQLQQGAFTYSLLQALRIQGEGNCATVERLDQYLRYTVPQINQQYNKPRQTPYAMVEPAAKYHLILLPRQATLRDAEALKMDAYEAETDRDYTLAEQLWIRVLAVSPADPDAIKAIRRLPTSSVPLATPTPTATPVLVGSSGNRGGSRETPPVSDRTDLSRRRLLQWLGLGAVGTGGVFLFSRRLQSPSPIPSPTPSPTTSPSPTPTPTPSPSPTPVFPGLTLQPLSFTVKTVDAQGQVIQEETKQAGLFRENLGSASLDLMGLPAGRFIMGSPDSELGRDSDEGPRHQVILPTFLIGRYPITQSQWQAVARLPKVKDELKLNPAYHQGANFPVEQVSWEEAVEFCARLSTKTGRNYRLPSEAEWEYACRAGTTTPFYFGPTITTDLANYKGIDFELSGKPYLGFYDQGPRGIFREKTTAVGSFPPNAFGLWDTHGNVWEWCLDYWHDDYNGAPIDGSAWVSGGDDTRRVIRGGSWSRAPVDCRSATRDKFERTSSYINLGFRVVLAPV